MSQYPMAHLTRRKNLLFPIQFKKTEKSKMCFYLALKVYILYSFFCPTFSPPGRTGSGCTELALAPSWGSSAAFTHMEGVGLALKSSLCPHSPHPPGLSTAPSDGATLIDIARCWGGWEPSWLREESHSDRAIP